ncbi:MAG: aspartate carbamoyltransferase [Clostridia bacterium]|nr:aspartate carbamoyltransferase [Clostridia bacterium]
MTRHLLQPFDLSRAETERILDLASSIEADPALYQDVAARKRLATLFYEASTRTRLSHETAMQKLGGDVIGFPSADVSSVSKGETMEDTVRVIQVYADIIAMRHPTAGAPMLAAKYSNIPIINAGDGGNEHPTQTLLDMHTIKKRLGRLDNFTIGFCGDLKYGRTVHSLAKSLTRYTGIKFYFISPEELRMPKACITEGMDYVETDSLEDAIGNLDILYMTRIQQERFASPEEYLKFKGVYILDGEKMKLAKPTMAVLHPLPRVDEITPEVDDDPRAAYFEQIQSGLHVRMALIMALLGLKDPKTGKHILDEQ